MCGICGWVDPEGGVREDAVRAMLGRLRHRGPDGEGLWRDPRGVAVFGHRRLKVLDPAPRADQPMMGAGESVLVFNGEMYAFRALRRELEAEGAVFRTTGDTEVVLAALERWGADALERFSGMFAFAWWDPGRRQLLVVRDRLGIKPLFWARVGRGVAFASEIPALLAHPGIGRKLDRQGLGAWLQLGYTAGEATIVRGVRRLSPGHLLEVTDGEVSIRRWYDLLEAVAPESWSGSAEDAADELDLGLRESVDARLISDVPLGCFLSGGVDSEAVTAAAAVSGARPETLTVSFEPPFDETREASLMAAALGLEHRVTACPPGEMEAFLDRWETVGSDPIADPSLAPTWVVSRAARERWTVALSGDGGDELFSGYPRLRFMPRFEKVWRAGVLRAMLAHGPLPASRWAAKLRAAVAAPDPWAAYQCLQGVWPRADAETLVGRGPLSLPWPDELVDRLEGEPPWRRYRLLDLLTFLPERVLAKVDRASMSHGLEVRVPLLDHRIVEFVGSLPEKLTRSKGLLRTVLSRYVRGAEPLRRKRGFEVPLGRWLRGPLRDAARELILGAATELDLDGNVLRRTWEEHQAGRGDYGERLLAIAVLARWRRRWLG